MISTAEEFMFAGEGGNDLVLVDSANHSYGVNIRQELKAVCMILQFLMMMFLPTGKLPTINCATQTGVKWMELVMKHISYAACV